MIIYNCKILTYKKKVNCSGSSIKKSISIVVIVKQEKKDWEEETRGCRRSNFTNELKEKKYGRSGKNGMEETRAE